MDPSEQSSEPLKPVGCNPIRARSIPDCISISHPWLHLDLEEQALAAEVECAEAAVLAPSLRKTLRDGGESSVAPLSNRHYKGSRMCRKPTTDSRGGWGAYNTFVVAQWRVFLDAAVRKPPARSVASQGSWCRLPAGRQWAAGACGRRAQWAGTAAAMELLCHITVKQIEISLPWSAEGGKAGNKRRKRRRGGRSGEAAMGEGGWRQRHCCTAALQHSGERSKHFNQGKDHYFAFVLIVYPKDKKKCCNIIKWHVPKSVAFDSFIKNFLRRHIIASPSRSDLTVQ